MFIIPLITESFPNLLSILHLLPEYYSLLFWSIFCTVTTHPFCTMQWSANFLFPFWCRQKKQFQMLLNWSSVMKKTVNDLLKKRHNPHEFKIKELWSPLQQLTYIQQQCTVEWTLKRLWHPNQAQCKTKQSLMWIHDWAQPSMPSEEAQSKPVMSASGHNRHNNCIRSDESCNYSSIMRLSAHDSWFILL